MVHNCMDCQRLHLQYMHREMLQAELLEQKDLEIGKLNAELSDYKNGVHQLVSKGWRPYPEERPIGIRAGTDE